MDRQVIIATDAQAESLIDFLRDNVGTGDPFAITEQPDGSIFVGGGLAAATITPDGEVDEG